MLCDTCGTENPQEAIFCKQCGNRTGREAGQAEVNPAYSYAPSPPRRQAPPPDGEVRAQTAPPPIQPPRPGYAGFWKRFVAFFIDSMVLGIPTCVGCFSFVLPLVTDLRQVRTEHQAVAVVIGAVGTFMVAALVVNVLYWLYFALMESSTRQGTLGKMAMGLLVTDMDSRPVSFGRASGRYFAKLVTNIIPFGIGYMMAGWTAKKQAVHDMIASTLVVNRPDGQE